MNKIQKIAVILLLFFMSSCDRIYFDETQPVDSEAMTSIPEDLQGTWTDKNVSLTIDSNSYRLTKYRGDTLYKTEIYTLSDSVILKKAGNLYVANIKRGDWWELVIIKKNKSNEILGYYPDFEKVSKNKKITFCDKKKDVISYIYHYKAELKTKEIRKLNPRSESRFVILKPDSTMSDDAL